VKGVGYTICKEKVDLLLLGASSQDSVRYCISV
jgi:hypothetical protein